MDKVRGMMNSVLRGRQLGARNAEGERVVSVDDEHCKVQHRLEVNRK